MTTKKLTALSKADLSAVSASDLVKLKAKLDDHDLFLSVVDPMLDAGLGQETPSQSRALVEAGDTSEYRIRFVAYTNARVAVKNEFDHRVRWHGSLSPVAPV